MATSFKIEHDFLNIPLDKFVAHLNDPKLNRMLQEGLDFEERSLSAKTENPREIEWKFLVKKSGKLPAPIKKLVKDDALAWQEISRLVKKEHCIYWQILPLSQLLKFHGEGTWQLTALKKGCRRTIEGKVSVDIPLLGKVVESFIVNELLKSYEIEPSIQEQFYAEIG